MSHGFKVAYDVGKTKAVRNAFRRQMARAPEAWDWAAAHVPSGLSEEQEEEKEEKEKAKAKEKEKKTKKWSERKWIQMY